MTTGDFDEEVDTLIVGSGAAGMAAALASEALGLTTLVVEKTKYFGGTTAYSGGGMWVPDNHVLRRDGMTDTPEAARAYLDAVLALNDDDVSETRRDMFFAEGPNAVALLEQRASHLRFDWVRDYPDYHPELPGASTDGRQIQPRPVDLRILGAELANQRRAEPMVPQPFGMWIRIDEAQKIVMVGHSWRARAVAVRFALRGALAKLRGKKMAGGGGQMLVAALRAGLAEHGIPLWLASPLDSLVTDDTGAVVGATVVHEGAPRRIRVRKGVILASGGFERDDALREKFQQQPTSARWTLGAGGNTGDGLRAGLAVGATLALMDDAWWAPGLLTPEGRSVFLLTERQAPGSLVVNGAGRRFVDESTNYVNFCQAMYAGDRTGVSHIPCWFVVDQTYRNRYKIGGFLPRRPIPKTWFESGVAVRAGSMRELAAAMDVPIAELTETVERFNGFAATGKDLDFARGDNAYDRYYGDPKQRPNPCLGPLRRAPFYAFKVVPGDIGTKGGLLTDEFARVLREDGSAVEGLYAAGNTSASVMGHEYPGPGSTIGAAVTFGYVAAKHLAAR